MVDLDTTCENSLNLPSKTLRLLTRLQIRTIRDLIFHMPIRYEDWTPYTSIKKLRPGITTAVQGWIEGIQVHPLKRCLISYLKDETGVLALLFFQNVHRWKQLLKPGKKLLVYGVVKAQTTSFSMVHPQINWDQSDQAKPRINPVYLTTKGLSQKKLRELVLSAFKTQEANLPAERLLTSLYALHFPQKSTEIAEIEQRTHPALQWLIREELLCHRLAQHNLAEQNKLHASYNFPNQHSAAEKRLMSQLGFQLTAEQRRVLEEIYTELSHSTPMTKLLQGDVGSGKTVVAALAALRVLSQGKQVLLMAPTTLLVLQHASRFKRWFAPLGIAVICISGGAPSSERKQLLSSATAKSTFFLGTHALLYTSTAFAQLGLVIIDEQHRFGVEQRAQLLRKGSTEIQPHLLYLTATPIPRSLAMAYCGHLSISTIKSLPPNRKPIKTILLPQTSRGLLIKRLASNYGTHHQLQGYWICTLIDDSNAIHAAAAESTYQSLMHELPQVSIGLLHGQMDAADKMRIMQAFEGGQYQLLVSTVAIEVGIDVPNASFIVIENAERLGLAQLHQLRGRVGRSDLPSACILLAKLPITQQAQARLQAIKTCRDGFDIADADLSIRGSGDWLGTKQSGAPIFRYAQLPEDSYHLTKIHSIADTFDQQTRVQKLNNWFGSAIGLHNT